MTVIVLGAGYAEMCKSSSGGGSAETADESQYGAAVPTSRIVCFYIKFTDICIECIRSVCNEQFSLLVKIYRAKYSIKGIDKHNILC